MEEKRALLDIQKKDYIQRLKGLCATFFYLLCIVTSASSVQLLQHRMADFELNSITCGSAAVISSIGLLLTRKWPVIERKQIVWTLMYSMCNFVWPISLYIDVRLLPVAMVECIVQTTSICAGIFLFWIFLKEKPRFFLLISAILCISGVILVIQPNCLFDNKQSTFVNNTTEPMEITKGKVHHLLHVLKYCLPLVTGLTLPVDVLILKKRPVEHMAEVLFWSFIINAFLSITLMLIFGKVTLPNNWYDVMYITLHCLFYALMWPSYMYAVKYVSGNTFSIICSINNVHMLFAQYTVLSSILPGHKNWIEIIGVILVMVRCILSSVIEVCRPETSNLTNDN